MRDWHEHLQAALRGKPEQYLRLGLIAIAVLLVLLALFAPVLVVIIALAWVILP